ncbi:MAG: phosphomannomutase/phosphoglucomutase [Clostridia bacterium]|nr:phosphomannomutase/phosphoglucomutase [Clostridia bacterium]
MRSEWMKLRSGSDIRGDAMEHDGLQPLLTAETAECVGYAFALWLARRGDTTADKLTIAVGHDSRLTGPALKDGIIKGLTAADCDVLDCGLCTTPAMFMTTVQPETGCDGAVMITASHHPWYRNGFKLITRQGGLNGAEIADILTAAMAVTLPQRLVKPCDFLSVYTERLASMVRERLEDDALKPLLGLHVVVDAGNGAGGFYAQFLSDLGAEVEGSQYLEPDGRFPNHIPNPEDKDAMAAVSRAVRENGADLGVIFDTDCDRAAIVDEQGHEINRNRLIALISAILLNEKPGQTIVTDSVTSSGLAKFIAEWGGVHYRFKRGYRNVIDEAIRLNEEGIECPIAIETSGHAALKENYFLDDGMYLVTRLICEAMERKRQGLTLTSLLEGLAEPLESVEVRMNILEEDYRTAGQAVIETILSKTLEDAAWHLAPDNREGVRISFDLDGGVDNAWFLLRLSVHDPVMPLNAESDVKGGVQFMLKALYELLEGSEELDLTPLKKLIEG